MRNFTSGLIRCLGFTAAALALSMAVAANDKADHPLLSRIAGVALISKEIRQFDSVHVSVAGSMPGGGREVTYEGRVTRIDYGTIKGDPPGEVAIYRNYLAAAKKMGGRQLNVGFDQTSSGLSTSTHVFALSASEKPPIAVLYINNAYNYDLTIIEPAEMEQSVNAGAMAEQIKKTGFTTLYINFDTGKSTLQADGQVAVKEIAGMLKSNPAMKLSIDGHTDNVGAPASNKQLSQARAQAVMAAVVAQGIDAKRLKSAGYGEEKPVADNRTDEGRAKNRRVELVAVK